MFRDNDYSLPSITRESTAVQPCITRKSALFQPSITRWEEEIERLKVEVRRLSEENAFLVERGREKSQVANLETLRARVLKDLKLGKQAPGYKAAQKALERFIAELTRSA